MLRKITLAVILMSSLIIVIKAQETNLDWHLIEIGPLRQVIKNTGFGGASAGYEGQYGSTEYPLGSFVTYGAFSPWIGAVREEEELVSSAGPWADHFGNRHELYPTAEPWDTVWVINNREIVDIPYWPNYQGVSDQDVVCRYNDYTIRNIQDHVPLYIDIIQVTYAWISMEFLVHQFYIIPTRDDLTDVYVGFFGNMGIGKRGEANVNDSFGSFDTELGVGFMDGGHPWSMGPMGFKLFADESEDALNITWSDRNTGIMTLELPPSTDDARYRIMSTPGIYHDEVQDRGYGYFYYGKGPYRELAVGDTIHFTFAQIMGIGYEGVKENLSRLLMLKGQDFHVPAPPPTPPLSFKVGNHQVTLRWDPQPGDVNPETYEDRYRLDGETEPFEGCRIYKSFTSKTGPWTLLAEYDRPDDDIGHNLGLEYVYTDVGLLNNLEYYYTVTAFSKPNPRRGRC